MKDDVTITLFLAAFALIIVSWAWYNYCVRQTQKYKDLKKAFAEDFPLDKSKKRPTLKKATTKEPKMATKPGLYANIHKKQVRIEKEKAEGKPVEKMRKPGTKGAPTAKAFKESAKTAKKK